MRILLLSATAFEISPLLEDDRIKRSNQRISTLITGAGLVPCTYNLTRKLTASDFDLVIHAGIAGTFNRDWPLGKIVILSRDFFADTGARDKDGSFLTMNELGLWDPNATPFKEGYLHPLWPHTYPKAGLPEATGITVSTVSGHEPEISRIAARFQADVETMETAAAMYVCALEDIPLLSVRAISNYVEPRNKDTWDIPLAIKNLNDYLADWISKL